jgi:tripartite-type tricarboxylate transporter receptor subunit TctC
MLRLFVLLLFCSLNAHAQQWPAKPIKLVVPHAPGGNSDTFGRILAAKLGERVGQQVIVENRAGAGGTVASEYIARLAPDGYTLIVGDNGTHAVAPTLFSKLPYKVPADFTSITLGLQMVHVPYKGGAPAVQAALAGDVQLTSVSVNTGLPHIKSGRLRALAIASAKRSPAIPEVPTLAESGVTGAEADSWLAIFGPPGMPEAIVAKLQQEIAAALNDPPIKERLAGIGLTVVASTQAQLQGMLPGELNKWGEAVRRSGAKVD